ncbi:hypothetical protein N7530_001637 [Penicillium desertorum]|uniref:Uncharacterized protein n=1 Tax=Penicillium desertorum TaxID=1303715 RepID=A0A9X0BWT1_9EURO|nr:hypothetical protein N7530_001637 [Penicillium desertorum]
MGPKRKVSSPNSSPPSKSQKHGTPSKSPKPRKGRSAARAISTAPSMPHRTTSLSPLNTNIQDTTAWEVRRANAEARIDRYVLIGEDKRPSENILKQSLRALLEWLPPGGRDHHARLILRANSDEALWRQFWDVCCYLAAPSKPAMKFFKERILINLSG